MVKKYEKPTICFEEIRVSENIANDCWAEINGDKSVFYGDKTGLYELILKSDQTGCSKAQLDYVLTSTGQPVTGDILTNIQEIFEKTNGANTRGSGFSDDRPS